MGVKTTYRINLAEHRVDIAGLPAGLEGLRIAHFGDLHAPKSPAFLEQVNGMLRRIQPDLLVTTGDILDIPHWLSAARRQLPILLGGVHAPLGFFASLGNHDRSWIIPVLQEFGATVLLNHWQPVQRNGATLHIGGIYSRSYRKYAAACRTFAQTVPQDGPAIVLSHLPSAIWPLSKTAVKLVLAGHTHAGQWRFGRFGCLWTHDDLPRHMAGGLHKVESTHLFVTAGLGESGPVPVRFGCPPEIALLTLCST
jgi:uncharacterized protein